MNCEGISISINLLKDMVVLSCTLSKMLKLARYSQVTAVCLTFYPHIDVTYARNGEKSGLIHAL